MKQGDTQFVPLFYSKSSNSPIGFASLILFIASANRGAIVNTFILSIRFSVGSGIVLVNTNSLIGEFCILSTALADKIP